MESIRLIMVGLAAACTVWLLFEVVRMASKGVDLVRIRRCARYVCLTMIVCGTVVYLAQAFR
jgi:hypothetical protein